MAFLKDIKRIIKEADNQEVIVKHVIYYLYSSINENKNIEILLKKNQKFYFENMVNIDNRLDEIIKDNIEDLREINPGTIYEKITTKKFKKALGQIYTPTEIVEEMIDMYNFELKNKNIQLKIIDISCGSGYFLLPLIEKLTNFGINYKDAVSKHIFGVDKDDFSVFLTKLSIMLKYPELKEEDLNIFQGDILFDGLEELMGEKFDLIIGNPPYIGHKNISREYKDKLYEKFITYKNKSDISYCFFEKGLDMLKNDGNLIFITSRYFMEGQDSLELRKFLQKSFKISKIIDYNGYNLFKNANISPLIIKLIKSKFNGNFEYEYKNKKGFKKIKFNQNRLEKDKWIIRPKTQLDLLRKLYCETNSIIDDYIDFKQGIITGLDKAFVVKKEDIEKYSLENELLKEWIKNSNIYKDKIIDSNNFKLIYSKDIDIDKYPNTKKYLMQFKERLENRRECKKGIINWYELQWPRTEELFEKEKIIFPYKAKKPIFFHDINGYFCSADIYIASLKHNDLIHENVVKYLNSNIFKFICSIELKKVGRDLYEFYPYSLKRLPIINKKYLIDSTENGYICYEKYLNKVFNLNKEEINIINSII